MVHLQVSLSLVLFVVKVSKLCQLDFVEIIISISPAPHLPTWFYNYLLHYTGPQVELSEHSLCTESDF